MENKKIKTVGIVAEFNPFHQGHSHLVKEIDRELGNPCKVSVMSGNFTQRGEFAVYDKWERAAAAVSNGINLVVELPVVYACSNAGDFARGAVSILEAMGNVDYLAFGSETGDLESLIEFADFQKENEEKLKPLIKEFSSKGMSYPKAREEGAKILGFNGNTEEFNESNNILALEYLKNIVNMEPIAIKRSGEGYIESASKIRREMFANDKIGLETMEKRYFDLIRMAILSGNYDEMEEIASSGEGLSNRLKKQVRYASTRDELIESVKSKRYTYTRIGRLLCQTLLGIKAQDCKNGAIYIRPLAMDKIGASILKKSKKKSDGTVAFVDSINKAIYDFPEIEKTLMKDVMASDVFNIISGRNMESHSDFIKKPVIIRR